MIVNNKGITKLVKINGELIVINSGINTYKDSDKLKNIVLSHKDLSIVTNVVKVENKPVEKPKKNEEKVKKEESK